MISIHPVCSRWMYRLQFIMQCRTYNIYSRLFNQVFPFFLLLSLLFLSFFSCIFIISHILQNYSLPFPHLSPTQSIVHTQNHEVHPRDAVAVLCGSAVHRPPPLHVPQAEADPTQRPPRPHDKVGTHRHHRSPSLDLFLALQFLVLILGLALRLFLHLNLCLWLFLGNIWILFLFLFFFFFFFFFILFIKVNLFNLTIFLVYLFFFTSFLIKCYLHITNLATSSTWFPLSFHIITTSSHHSFLLQQKYTDDVFFTNTFLASVGGVPTAELNTYELRYLTRMRFCAEVSVVSFFLFFFFSLFLSLFLSLSFFLSFVLFLTFSWLIDWLMICT